MCRSTENFSIFAFKMTFYLIKIDSTQKSFRGLKSISTAAFINLKITMRLYKRLCKTLLEKKMRNQILEPNLYKQRQISWTLFVLLSRF